MAERQIEQRKSCLVLSALSRRQLTFYPGCQSLFQRGFRFLPSLYSDPREKFFLAASPLVAAAFGQHQKFPPYARKASGTQGTDLPVLLLNQLIHISTLKETCQNFLTILRTIFFPYLKDKSKVTERKEKDDQKLQNLPNHKIILSSLRF